MEGPKEKKSKKSFFDVKRSQKRRNRNLIRMKSDILSKFCETIGLQVDEIILSRKQDVARKPKITIIEQSLSDRHMIFKTLYAKDITNLSNIKYRQWRKILKEIDAQRLPGIKQIVTMQHELNNFFKIRKNNYGFFVNPIEKINLVCSSFLKKNPNFNKTVFEIKLSADGTRISSTKIQVLNFTFNLIDDEKNSSSVLSTYLLGK